MTSFIPWNVQSTSPLETLHKTSDVFQWKQSHSHERQVVLVSRDASHLSVVSFISTKCASPICHSQCITDMSVSASPMICHSQCITNMSKTCTNNGTALLVYLPARNCDRDWAWRRWRVSARQPPSLLPVHLQEWRGHRSPTILYLPHTHTHRHTFILTRRVFNLSNEDSLDISLTVDWSIQTSHLQITPTSLIH